jgi:hypothetical protein
MRSVESNARKPFLMSTVAAVGALATTAMVTLPANDAGLGPPPQLRMPRLSPE